MGLYFFGTWCLVFANVLGVVIDIKGEPVICISNGCIRGTTMQGYKTGLFEAFFGIPYAKPPVGKLRFANPVAPNNWTGILDVSKPKPECIQKNYLVPNPIVTGSEDCLYLNVYRPLGDFDSPRRLLPVMVFIHGGAFFAGTANPSFHGPQYFMDNGEVILVLMAYRLGALGFLSTGDEESSGNFGLKDQTLALKWVQENIEEFSGDPNTVTIFGVSAGGASVHMHMMSPLSQNLFHKAIVMSGSAIAPYNEPYKKPINLARRQAELVGIRNPKAMSNRNLIKELRKINASKLIDSGDGLRYWSVDPLLIYRPVIEKNITGAFLVEDMKIISKSGNYNHIPWLTGVVQNEGSVRAAAIIANKTLLSDFNSRIDELLPKLVSFDVRPPKKTIELVQKLKKFYLNGSNTITDDNAQGFCDIISDSSFLYPFYKSIENYIQYADTNKNPVYLYRFAFKGPLSYSVAFTGTFNDYGVIHLDDTIYLFHSDHFPEFAKDSGYADMIKKLVDTYVHFAKYGEPILWSEIKPCNKQYDGEICDYLEFSNSPDEPDKVIIKTKNKFDLNMIKFWNEL